MVKNEHEVVIASSPERVFRFVTDFDTWRQWHGDDEADKITPGPVDVGTVWQLSGSIQGEVVIATVEVTQWEPNRRYAFATTSGPIQARQEFRFENADEGRNSPPSSSWPTRSSPAGAPAVAAGPAHPEGAARGCRATCPPPDVANGCASDKQRVREP